MAFTQHDHIWRYVDHWKVCVVCHRIVELW